MPHKRMTWEYHLKWNQGHVATMGSWKQLEILASPIIEQLNKILDEMNQILTWHALEIDFVLRTW